MPAVSGRSAVATASRSVIALLSTSRIARRGSVSRIAAEQSTRKSSMSTMRAMLRR